MNEKETVLHNIANIVIECCSINENPISKEEILGPGRSEHIIMARCILVRLLKFAGFQTYTIATILHKKNENTIRHLLTISTDFRNQNYLYKKTEDEAFKKFLSLTQQ